MLLGKGMVVMSWYVWILHTSLVWRLKFDVFLLYYYRLYWVITTIGFVLTLIGFV